MALSKISFIGYVVFQQDLKEMLRMISFPDFRLSYISCYLLCYDLEMGCQTQGPRGHIQPGKDSTSVL